MGIQEGTIRVDGYQVWYRRVGRGGIPLMLLHGGPGAGHDYLEPLEALAADRLTVFYDQLGCGRSDQPDEDSQSCPIPGVEILRQPTHRSASLLLVPHGKIGRFPSFWIR